MKKTINKLVTLSICALGIISSCTSQDKPEEIKTDAQILAQVSEVKAIGKVVPSDDQAIVASEVTGIVRKIWVNEGDSVLAGQKLIELESTNALFTTQETVAQLQSLVEKNKTLRADIEKAEIYARELLQKYEISKKLYQSNAETKEKLDTDYSNWQQQLVNIKGLRQQLKAQQVSEKEKQIQIQKNKSEAANYIIKASKTGILMDFNTKLGQNVTPNEELAKILNIENPIIEAEVDELFAQDVKVGNKVVVMPIGRKDTIAVGTIYYTNPILSNKSIIYETANESEDRRVRKIKIKINNANDLIINAKVDCIINIK